MSAKIDCLVLGLGGVGCAALLSAAKRGWNVLGIDQFAIAHDRGSSHGQSRIIRQAYYEHPSYVPLSIRAFEKWREIENDAKTPLLIETGLLQVGWPERGIIQGVVKSAMVHDLDVEHLTVNDCRKRFPMFRFPDDQIGIFEKNAGILLVEKCVSAIIDLARQQGASVRTGQKAHKVNVQDGVVEVKYGDERIVTERVIICPGAWASQWSQVAGLDSISLKIVRKHQHWYEFGQIAKSQSTMPVYLFETDEGYFYGFPKIDSTGFKVAEHTGGDVVDDPSNVDRNECPEDVARVEQFLDQRIISSRTRNHHSVCMYTLSPDKHFVVDLAKGHSNIAFAAGMSGHGFKFAPVIGDYLIDLLEGQRDARFSFLESHGRG